MSDYYNIVTAKWATFSFGLVERLVLPGLAVITREKSKIKI